MGKILSQEEIDALLGPGASGADGTSRATVDEPVMPYNFLRPDRATREQIRSLHFMHDRFARNVSTSLSAYLRAVTEVAIVSAEQFTYSEFLMSLPDPTAFYGLSLKPVEGLGALELNPVIAFTMIDRMLGGSGQRVALARALTEIEQNVIDGVVKHILDALTEAWAAIVPVQFRTTGRETRPQMLQVAAPNEPMILLTFEIRIGGAGGMLHVCIPTSVIEALGASFTQSWSRTRRTPTEAEHHALIANLARVPMSVSALLRTSVSAREFMELGVGDVLSLGVPIQDPLVVRVGRRDQFVGRPVRAGANTGVRITAGERVEGGLQA